MRTNQLEKLILELLLTENQITRKRVLEACPTRPATLFAVVQDMVKRGIIREPQRTGRNTGSRASPIELNPRHGLFIGIELDPALTTGVCIDARGNILCQQSVTNSAPIDRPAAQAQVAAVIEHLRQQLGPDWVLVRGVGFADPGLVDNRRGRSVKAVNLTGWEDVPTGDWLTKLTGVPVHLVGAPLARAYAEYISATASRPRSLVHVQLDEGIGAGFIEEGRLFLGAGSCAMEIGHVVVQEDGPLCRCGNRGCLEAVAGIAGIRSRLAEMARQRVISPLTREAFSIALWRDCLQTGDKAASNLGAEVGKSVGQAVSSLTCILNPDVIIFSGALTGLGTALVDQIRQVLSQHCLSQALEHLDIRISTLGETGTAWGGALIARRQAFL
jgi:predicted NBD/HSP70 family sugar kinase